MRTSMRSAVVRAPLGLAGAALALGLALATEASGRVAPSDDGETVEPATAAEGTGATTGEGSAPAAFTPSLTAAERAAGWRLLHDGKTFAGWRGFRIEGVPAGWTVENGVIHLVPPAPEEQPAEAQSGAAAPAERADLITEEQFESFELALEWAVTPGGNSGIFFRVTEDAERTYHTGPEYQILDNAGHRDGQRPETSAGSNYALHAPSRDVTRPVGEWNEARILVDGAHVTHWLNGTKLLEYDLWTEDWKRLVAASKFAAMPRYGLNKTGHIALQDHGNDVRFRGLKIRPLKVR